MKLSQHGDFDPSLVDRAREAMSFRFSEVDSAESYDFARCQRADGSFYGTAGQCRLGSPAEARAEVEKLTKRIARQEKAVQRLAGMTGVSRGEVEIERNELKQLKDRLAEAKRIQRNGPPKARSANDIFLDLQKLGKGPSAQKEALLKEYFAAVGTAPAPPKPKSAPKPVGGTAEQRMVLKRLEERLDSAVTRREQERVSEAIRQLTREMDEG